MVSAKHGAEKNSKNYSFGRQVNFRPKNGAGEELGPLRFPMANKGLPEEPIAFRDGSCELK